MAILPRGSRCSQFERLSQSTLYASLRDTESTAFPFFESMTFDDWEIVSFESRIGFACVRLKESQLLLTVNLRVSFPS